MTRRHTRRRLLAAFGCGVAATASAGCLDGPSGGDEYSLDADDGWPSFGADARNSGHVETTGPLDPEVAWEFETTNTIFDGAAVADGRVYVGSTDGNLYALDAEDGEEEWRFSVRGQVRTTPAVANDTVFVGGRRGGLYALDASTGERSWSVLDGTGFALSHPTVAEGTVYAASRDGILYAVDAASGDVDWTYDLDGRGTAAPAVDDGRVFVGWRGDTDGPGPTEGGGAAAVTTDGEEEWRVESGDGDGSPTVADGVVYAGIDADVVAYDASDGEELWRFETDGGTSSPAVVDGTVYVGSHDTHVYALDAEDGEEEWRYGGVNWMHYAPAVADGILYASGWTDRVYGIDADEGESLWTVTLETPLSDPAVADGTVYVATEDTLVALRDE